MYLKQAVEIATQDLHIPPSGIMFNFTCVKALSVGVDNWKMCRWLGPHGCTGNIVSQFASVWVGSPDSRNMPSTDTSGAWLPLKNAVSISHPNTLPEETPSCNLKLSLEFSFCLTNVFYEKCQIFESWRRSQNIGVKETNLYNNPIVWFRIVPSWFPSIIL